MRTLSGDVTDVALPDVLRFLSSTASSGVLTFHGTGSDAGVYLRDGGICVALLDVTRVPLGPRLVTLGLADAASVAAARKVGDGTALGLANAVMRTAGDAAAASALAADHTAETIGWLSLGTATAFEFDATEAVQDWPLPPLVIDDVLAAADRCARQWADLRGAIGDLSHLASCVPQPPDPADIRLTALRWRIVALVDGHRTVKDVLELSGVGQLDATRELAALVEAGLVELVEPHGHSVVDALVHDVRAAGPLAIGEPWRAHGGSVREVAQPPATAPAGPQAPSLATPGDDQAQSPQAAGDANLRLLDRLIDRTRDT